MVNFDDWLSGGNSPMDESLFAVRAWRLIQRKPGSIALTRGTTVLAAQTVRIEYGTDETEIKGRSGAMVARRDIVVFGVKGHPDTENVPDTDIRRGDIFTLNGQGFRVTDVVHVVGGVQAQTEAIT